MQKKSLNMESARALISKVELLRKDGLGLEEATKQCGTSVHVFGYWKQKLGSKKRTYKKSKSILVEAAPAPHIVAQFVLFSDGKIANMDDLKRAA